jgi:spermidine synthase
MNLPRRQHRIFAGIGLALALLYSLIIFDPAGILTHLESSADFVDSREVPLSTPSTLTAGQNDSAQPLPGILMLKNLKKRPVRSRPHLEDSEFLGMLPEDARKLRWNKSAPDPKRGTWYHIRFHDLIGWIWLEPTEFMLLKESPTAIVPRNLPESLPPMDPAKLPHQTVATVTQESAPTSPSPAFVVDNPGQPPWEFPPDQDLSLSEKILYSTESLYQRLTITENNREGRSLLLNEEQQTTERTFIYYDEPFHLVLLAHPRPDRVLIIGCGDGGIIREALKHPVRRIDQVEIDRKVIEVAKKYLPKICSIEPNGGLVWNDPRVHLIIKDGREFLRTAKEPYDIIIVDLPAPTNEFVNALYTREFHALVKKNLRPGGYFMRNAPRYGGDTVQSFLVLYKTVATVFGLESTFAYNAFSGYILAANQAPSPAALSEAELTRRLQARQISTHFYTPARHFQYFLSIRDLPANVPICTDDNMWLIYQLALEGFKAAREEAGK